MIGIKEILVGFFFLYWIVHDATPFSIWWIIIICLAMFLFESVIASILEGFSTTIKKSSIEINKLAEGFEERLNKLENDAKRDDVSQ